MFWLINCKFRILHLTAGHFPKSVLLISYFPYRRWSPVIAAFYVNEPLKSWNGITANILSTHIFFFFVTVWLSGSLNTCGAFSVLLVRVWLSATKRCCFYLLTKPRWRVRKHEDMLAESAVWFGAIRVPYMYITLSDLYRACCLCQRAAGAFLNVLIAHYHCNLWRCVCIRTKFVCF